MVPAKRWGRPRMYDLAVEQALIASWEAANRIGGKRLNF